MDAETILKFLDPAVLIVIPVLIALGTMLKSTPKVKDWTIPYILTLLGIVFATSILCITNGIQPLFVLNGILQGVLCAASAVYVYQLYIQAVDKRKEDNKLTING